MDIALLIIAGGKSSRMGIDKRWIRWQGKSFLENIIGKGIAAGFSEIIICAERHFVEFDDLLDEYANLKIVFDQIEAFGPMEGLRQGLSSMKADFGWAVSCDMPFFDFQQLSCLKDCVNEANMAVIPVTDGRYQPVAAIYNKRILKNIDNSIKLGLGKMKCILQGNDIVKVNCSRMKSIFFNVNNEADYRLALGRNENLQRNIPIISISASKSNTGKTTFIAALIKKLSCDGIRCGVIKRDCHGFNLDIKGKDSYRFTEAGANAVAVVSPNAYFIMQRTNGQADLLDVIDKMENVDLIFVESRAHGIFPIISLWRTSGEINIDEKTVALFTSNLQNDVSVSQYDINDISSAEYLTRFLAGFDN